MQLNFLINLLETLKKRVSTYEKIILFFRYLHFLQHILPMQTFFRIVITKTTGPLHIMCACILSCSILVKGAGNVLPSSSLQLFIRKRLLKVLRIICT